MCLTCKDPLSTPDSVIGCNCPIGYYDSVPGYSNIICEPCHVHCYSCEEADVCLVCIDEDNGAITNPTIGCECPPG